MNTFESILNQLRIEHAETERRFGMKCQELEQRTAFLYNLRSFIETGIKGKWDSQKLLEEVKNRLDSVCPHGKDNKVD